MTFINKVIAVCVYLAIGWLFATLVAVLRRKMGKAPADGFDYALSLLAYPLFVAFIPPCAAFGFLRWASERVAKALVRREARSENAD